MAPRPRAEGVVAIGTATLEEIAEGWDVEPVGEE